MRDPKRIKTICTVVENVWLTQPDWRLGQLLVNVVGSDDIWYIEDDLLAKALLAWIKNNKKTKPYVGISAKKTSTTGHW